MLIWIQWVLSLQKLYLAVYSIMHTILKVRNSVKVQAWPWQEMLTPTTSSGCGLCVLERSQKFLYSSISRMAYDPTYQHTNPLLLLYIYTKSSNVSSLKFKNYIVAHYKAWKRIDKWYRNWPPHHISFPWGRALPCRTSVKQHHPKDIQNKGAISPSHLWWDKSS